MSFMKQKWLLCAPDYFDVEYEINPWMNKTITPDKSLAFEQWTKLYNLMINLNLDCHLVKQEKGLPDMVFTANAGLAKDNKVVIAKFRYKERQGEERFFKEWFDANGYKTFVLDKYSFEGEGDALFAGKKLFVAYGFRTDIESHEQVAKMLDVDKLISCQLIHPSFYHLDTCFCPINENEALCVIEAFSKESIRSMESEINLISVSKNDANCFGCNAVVMNNAVVKESSIIIPTGCVELPKILVSKNFKVYQTPMTEFLKAGGAAKCLTMKI